LRTQIGDVCGIGGAIDERQNDKFSGAGEWW
jgi:hypothetical protein